MYILTALFVVHAAHSSSPLETNTTMSPNEISVDRSLASSSLLNESSPVTERTPPFLGTGTRISPLGVYERSKLVGQLEADRANRRFTPNLRTNHMSEETIIGKIEIGRQMYSGHAASIFYIPSRPDLLIKYQVQCADIGTELHPSLREAWFMNDANRSNLAPAIISVSPPTHVCLEQEGKCMFSMPRAKFAECVENGGIVRYTIMNNLSGCSIREYRDIHAARNGAMKFRHAVGIGAAIVEALQRLHLRAHVVHGDIHAGNIMLYDKGGGEDMFLALVDFGMASAYSRLLPEHPIRRLGGWRSAMNTHWQIEGYAWAARDDLFKTIHLVAHLMNPHRYHEIELRMQLDSFGELVGFKRRGNLFQLDSFDPVEAIGDSVFAENKSRIRESLDEILRLVRNVAINDPLPYAEVIHLFKLCIDLARGRSSMTTGTPEPAHSTTASTKSF